MFRTILDKSPTVLLVTVCILLFGAATYAALPRESNPDVKVPVVLVTTPYIGVSPADIESLVSVPLENELAGVKDLKLIRSTSAEGISIIFMEFEPEAVIEEALQRVRDRVNRARPKLPDDAEETEIKEISFSDMPIMLVTIAGDVDEVKLKALGEELEEEISRIPGVLDSTLTGGVERRIFVQVDPNRLNHYGLSFDDVIGAIANENVNVPGGNVETGSANFLLRVPGEFGDARQIEGVAVKRKGDVPVFVRDVAKVLDGFADRDTYARMNGEAAVTISVTKRTGANILDIAEAVSAASDRHAARWPKAVSYRILADQSRQIRDMVSDLENNVISAFVLVVAVVLLFMGARNSAFIGLSIPLSMLLSFIFISAFGMTLNMMVLFSLVLALGMLVDNGIVLVENIYRHVEMGKDLRQASIDGAGEVAGAVAASTATTVAAFLPLVFWTGIMGQFMGYLPKTVIIVLLSSLVVAVVILPVFTARFMRAPKKLAAGQQDGDVGAVGAARQRVGLMMRGYRRFLTASLRHRYISLGLCTAALVGTFIAYGELNHGVEFFAETEPNRATIAVRAPDGTALTATDRMMRKVEGILAAEENVDVWVAETGVSGSGDPMDTSSGAYNLGRITVDFLPDRNMAQEGEDVRVEPTTDTIDRIRAKVLEIPGAKITVEKERMGPPVGSPIAVEISGDDFYELGDVAAVVRRELGKIPGATDLTDDFRVGRPEVRLRIDRGAAKVVGASTQQIAQTVRTAVAGTKASAIRDGEDEYDIMVELAPQFREDLQNVLNLRIPGKKDTSPDTFPVPLSAVASYELAGGSGAVRHLDQDLVVTINGDIQEGHNEAEVRKLVEAYIAKNQDRFAGIELKLGGANDEQRDAQAFLMNAFAIAIFLILFVLILQFDRLDMPLIILASVVMSLTGVLWGLVITGTPFGIMMTGIGVISLAGVVVNNAIVLLTYVQQLLGEGKAMMDALIEAGMARVRPVLLTAVTTILGLVPMALGISFDFANAKWLVGTQSSQWWGPMAVAVIFGLAFATLLTLVMVPTMYAALEDVRTLLGRLFGGGARRDRAKVGEAERPEAARG